MLDATVTMAGYVTRLAAVRRTPAQTAALITDLKTLAGDALAAVAELGGQPPAPAPAPALPVIGAAATHVSAVPTLNSDDWRYGIAAQSVVPNGYQALMRYPAAAGLLPAPHGPVPGIVLVHGGPLVLGQYDNLGSVVGQGLAQYAGLASLALDYATEPSDGAGWPTSGQQVAAGVAWLRANAAQFGVDPDRLFVLAHSYGGYFGFPAVEQGLAQVRGYVGIDAVAPMSTVVLDLALPVLLVEGSLDVVGETASATATLAAELAAQGVRGGYVVADGADHTSSLITRSVIDAVASFVQAVAP